MMDESMGDNINSFDSNSPPGGRKRNADEASVDSMSTSPNKRGRGRGRGGSAGGTGGGRGSRGGGRGGRGGRGRGGASTVSETTTFGDFDGGDDDTSLFGLVKAATTNLRLQQYADMWIKEYEENPDNAMIQLVQFFFAGTGCRAQVDPNLVGMGDYTALIRKMTEQYDEDSGDYPLISMGPTWRRFRQNLCDFIQVLIKQCRFNIIYDQVLMDNMISLLTALADSQVRAFRHTATLSAMKLVSALVEIVVQLRQNVENFKRQYDAEFSKSRPNNERLKGLEKKKSEIEENTEEVNNMISYLFKSVFVHRYRDAVPEIRSICIIELGQWTAAYPSMFLEDSYLKYIGWTLSDKHGEVRLKCLQTLLPLFHEEEFHSKLELFTSKFKGRIVSMALDKEFEVAVVAVKVIICILKYFPTVLGDRDCESIYELVFASHRGLAMTAGEFLNIRLFRPDPHAPVSRTKKGKARSINTPLIRALILFFIEADLHEHAAYLVDSMIDSNEMVKDWECMTDLLLEEPGPGEDALDDKEETVLIEIMVCAIKQAATGETPVGRAGNRKYMSQKEHKHIYEDKAKISKHFMELLPLLMQKYAADAEKIKNLLQIPLYFELEMYSSMRLEKHLDALLKSVEEILDKHTTDEVLLACSKVYECLCSEQVSAIQARCDTAKAKVIDGIVMRLRQNLQQFNEELDDLDDEDKAAILVPMKKVFNLYQCHDLFKWELWDLFFGMLQTPDEHTQSIPPEMLVRAIQCCHVSFIWDLNRLVETGCDKENTAKLKKRLDDLINICHVKWLDDDSAAVRETAFMSMCDLFVVFNWHLPEQHTKLQAKLQPLVLEVKPNVESRLLTFVRDNVFVVIEDDEVDEHQQIEGLHKRRNILAAFCKLLIYNVVRIKAAADIFQHYVRFYNDFGDIIKATLAKCRENNRILCARAMAASLSIFFSELKENAENGLVDRHSDGFASLRELAKRFALLLGPDPVKSRDAIASLHKEGIDFALHGDRHHNGVGVAPPNVAFLEALAELSNKLMKGDKKTILTYLEKQLPRGFSPLTDDWLPYITYKTSLQTDDMPPPDPGMTGATPRGRGRGRSRGTPGGRGDISGAFMPATTSTAVKRARLESDQLSDAGSDFRDAASRASVSFAN